MGSCSHPLHHRQSPRHRCGRRVPAKVDNRGQDGRGELTEFNVFSTRFQTQATTNSRVPFDDSLSRNVLQRKAVFESSRDDIEQARADKSRTEFRSGRTTRTIGADEHDGIRVQNPARSVILARLIGLNVGSTDDAVQEQLPRGHDEPQTEAHPGGGRGTFSPGFDRETCLRDLDSHAKSSWKRRP
jgi:hypothetical protein